MVAQRPPLRIISGEPARVIVRQSLAEMLSVIAPALGPDGRGVLCEVGTTQAAMAMGGCAIAKRTVGEQGAETVAPRILLEAMLAVQRDLGDGATRLACMTNAIYQSASLSVSRGGNPGQISRALHQTGVAAIQTLADLRCAMPSLAQIARAACGDGEIAALLGEVGEPLLATGALEVKEGEHGELRLRQHRGFCFDISPDIAGIGPAEPRIRIDMHNVYLLVIDEVIDDLGPMAPVLNAFVQNNTALVIIARGFVGPAAKALIDNRGKYCLNILGLVPEAVGLQAVACLEDVCVASGATLVGDATGVGLGDIQPAMLGHAAGMIVDQHRCMLTDPDGETAAMAQRQQRLLREADQQRYLALDQQRLRRRAARLNGHWAELFLGGLNPWETTQRIEKARAAIAAMRDALEHGVVAGGGAALARVALQLGQPLHHDDLHQMAARQAVIAGCKATQRQLASRHGTAASDWNDDLVDPFAITQTLLQRAVSVAATLLTIEVLV